MWADRNVNSASLKSLAHMYRILPHINLPFFFFSGTAYMQ